MDQTCHTRRRWPTCESKVETLPSDRQAGRQTNKQTRPVGSVGRARHKASKNREPIQVITIWHHRKDNLGQHKKRRRRKCVQRLAVSFPSVGFYVNVWKLFGLFREELSLLAIKLGSDANNDRDKCHQNNGLRWGRMPTFKIWDIASLILILKFIKHG